MYEWRHDLRMRSTVAIEWVGLVLQQGVWAKKPREYTSGSRDYCHGLSTTIYSGGVYVGYVIAPIKTYYSVNRSCLSATTELDKKGEKTWHHIMWCAQCEVSIVFYLHWKATVSLLYHLVLQKARQKPLALPRVSLIANKEKVTDLKRTTTEPYTTELFLDRQLESHATVLQFKHISTFSCTCRCLLHPNPISSHSAGEDTTAG